jgi:DinB family protein
MIRRDVVDLAETLESNAAELAELFASFAPASRLTPLGDEFCVVEHVCHLRDLERDGFTPRIRSLLDESDPLLFGFDGAGVAAASNYRSENAYDALNAFLELRKHNVDTVRAVPESDLQRTGHYAGADPITLAAVVAGILDHDRDHRDRLRAMLARAED